MRRSAGDPEANLAQRFDEALTELQFAPAGAWAIAVSGGGDSVALMHLAADWAKARHSIRPFVLTVDHGLRPESGVEAAKVLESAARLGLESKILHWTGPKPRTGIEEKARAARYRLMGNWCIENGANSLLLGHTSDDQVENFLLRLGRGSGVDGLSGMSGLLPLPIPGLSAVRLFRPLLGFKRAELRDYLIARAATWFEDPMNSDPGFARPRIRKLLPALAEAGISANRIASASAHLSRARLALDAQTQTFLAEHSHSAAAGIALDGEALARVPREIGLRAIAAVLIQMSGRSYRPRFERLERLFDGLHQQQFRRQTLAGCCISRTSDATAIFGARTVWVVREKARKTAAGYRRQNGPGPDLPDPSSEAP